MTGWGCAFSWASSAFSQLSFTSSGRVVQPRLPRHLGKAEQLSQGPRLPLLRFMGAPHFVQRRSVGSGGGAGGETAPFLSRFTIPLHFGYSRTAQKGAESPFSKQHGRATMRAGHIRLFRGNRVPLSVDRRGVLAVRVVGTAEKTTVPAETVNSAPLVSGQVKGAGSVSALA